MDINHCTDEYSLFLFSVATTMAATNIGPVPPTLSLPTTFSTASSDGLLALTTDEVKSVLRSLTLLLTYG